jgi:single-strand DNA-binding protein
MYDTTVTVVGNIVDEPQLRVTTHGNKVVNFRVASTARRRDRVTGEWGDGDSLYLAVSCWRDLGPNVVDSLHKGDPVIVTGRVFTRPYERDGQQRNVYEVDALAVGPDLARGTAQFRRTPRNTSARAQEPTAGSGALAQVLRMVGRDGAGPEDDGAGGSEDLLSAAP